MSQQLYKAVLRGTVVRNDRMPDIAWLANQARATSLIRKACCWILDHNKEADFVQSYNNADAHTCEAVIVLRDRDTALMLKLALS
ncbi:hypothetical protein C8J42_102543 [Sphingomonas sp. PP-CE-1A-559]|uniref:hypothetical protein n=1 Tax=Sphingomonas sp. PP-CE-1A-559 TaxID=2135657 RepID=UPI001055B39B|nr:hypothetical protein [Sphingomonas sp. PP-CE-1A-559]TCP92767.1 hypothetical protein C8J42_102543 [Sphingomonas sp. PP-CE-1A-559]